VLPIGKAKVMREGKDVTLVSFSKMVGYCLKVAGHLAKEGIECEVRCIGRVQGPGGASPVGATRSAWDHGGWRSAAGSGDAACCQDHAVG
jgi:hypothetical protein